MSNQTKKATIKKYGTHPADSRACYNTDPYLWENYLRQAKAREKSNHGVTVRLLVVDGFVKESMDGVIGSFISTPVASAVLEKAGWVRTSPTWANPVYETSGK